MDQFNIWKLISRQWKIVLPLVAIVFAASLAAYSIRPKGVAASFSVTAVSAPKSRATNGQLVLQDNASQDTSLALGTTSSWFTDPSYVQQLVKDGVPVDDASVRGLSKVFKVIFGQANSSSYDVQYSAATPADAAKLAASARTILRQGVEAYNAQDLSPVTLSATTTAEIVSPDTSSVPLTPIAGLLVGIIFALTVATLVDRRQP